MDVKGLICGILVGSGPDVHENDTRVESPNRTLVSLPCRPLSPPVCLGPRHRRLHGGPVLGLSRAMGCGTISTVHDGTPLTEGKQTRHTLYN